MPYSNYRQRLEKLSDRARLRPVIFGEHSETGIYWDLAGLVPREYGAYPKMDRESFRRLSAAVSQAAERLIQNEQDDEHLTRGVILLMSCERSRLRCLDLSPAEARQARFRLSQAEEIKGVLGDRSGALLMLDLMRLAKTTRLVTVSAAFLLPPMFPLVWLFLVIVNALRGRADNVSVGIKAPILFVVGLIAWRCLFVPYGFLNKLLPGRFLAALAFVAAAAIMWLCLVLWAPISPSDRTHFERSRGRAARVCKVLWILGAIAGAVACSLILNTAGVVRYLIFAAMLLCWSVFCVFVWAVAAYRLHVFGGIPGQGPMNNRLAQLLLVLLPMTGITGSLRPMPVVPWVLAFFTILLVGLIATHTPVSRLACLRAAWHLFRREGQIVATRTKIVRIMSTILLLAWIVLLVGVQMYGGRLSRVKSGLNETLSAHRPLPEANRETYERVLSRKYSRDPNAYPRAGYKEDVGLPMELRLVSPEDLQAIITERYAAGRPIREELLLKLMWQGGHDVRPLVLKTLKDPNALDVLIARAKWGQRSVKDELEHIFQDKMVELDETTAPIREDPNSMRSLIIRHAWGDETAQRRLQRTFQAKLVELSERVRGEDNNGGLRSELMMMLEIDSILHLPSRLRELIVDANMPELLEDTPRTKTSEPELLTSLFQIAGALAYLSNGQEAVARFYQVLDLVAPIRDDSSRSDLQQSAGVLLKAWAGYSECFFYRSLTGVPTPHVTALLKEYIRHRQLIVPIDEPELLDMFARAGDRELAEWLFRSVAEPGLTVRVSEYPDLVPTLQPINISRVEAMTHRYLEPTFAYLGVESIPLLLEHLDSDNDQLRAFIVWRVTSLGYEWPRDQLRELSKDSYWKVRLNALFGLNKDDLAKALDDENAVVRLAALMLSQARP